MHKKRSISHQLILAAGVLCLLSMPAETGGSSIHPTRKLHRSEDARRTILSVEFLGETSIPTGALYRGTEIGGLSGITFDSRKNLYYAISDDRSELAPARYYTLAIDLSDGVLNAGDVAITDVTTLKDKAGRPFAKGSIDPEGIAVSRNGRIYISSEGDSSALIPPFVNRFDHNGLLVQELSVPEKYLPTAVSGVRNNLAFESLTLTPDNHYPYTAVENALVQDGPAADVDQKSLSRILKYDLKTGSPEAEMVYEVDAVPQSPDPADGFRTNGLVELLSTDNNGTQLALERAFSVGKGNTVKLFEVLTQGALNVINLNDLFWEEEGIPFEIDPPVQKFEIADFGDFVKTVDNLEGMTWGPKLPDGRQTLIVVSDNNFSTTQTTQFIALALTMKKMPAATPLIETPTAVDDANAVTKL